MIKGRTYLHYACDYGQIAIIEFLLTKGADINVGIFYIKNDYFFLLFLFNFKIPDKYNITPLLAAIWENHVACVNLLIRKVDIMFIFYKQWWPNMLF